MWIFDVIALNGHLLRDVCYHFRLQSAYLFLRQLGISPFRLVGGGSASVVPHQLVRLSVDEYIGVKPVWYHDEVKLVCAWMDAHPTWMPQDGLIFVPCSHPLKREFYEHVFKWKRLHTLDFHVVEHHRKYELSAWDHGALRVFARFITDENEVFEDVGVYECTGPPWRLMKRRPDKVRPNSWGVVQHTVQVIADQVSLAELLI